KVGTLLGEVGVNIEAAMVSQTTERSDAIMMLRVDRPVEAGVLEPIGAAVGARIVRTVIIELRSRSGACRNMCWDGPDSDLWYAYYNAAFTPLIPDTSIV